MTEWQPSGDSGRIERPPVTFTPVPDLPEPSLQVAQTAAHARTATLSAVAPAGVLAGGSKLDLDVLAEMGNGAPMPGRSPVTNKFTYVLLALVGLVGAFSAGAWYQREHGAMKTTVTSSGAANAGGVAGAGATPASVGSGGRGGLAAAGAGSTVAAQSATTAPPAGSGTAGTVKLIDGANVYIADAAGNIVKVTTQASTVVNVSKVGTVADLKPGDTIVVQGAAGADGFIAATAISGR